MTNVAVWDMSSGEPKRLRASHVDLEVQLEEWIDKDPDLVEFGLVILGRQVAVDAGFVDLLAIDPQGRWYVIEIKRGDVDRRTVAQTLDDAACVDAMDGEELRNALRPHLEERRLDLDEILSTRDALDSLTGSERDVVMVVVGTGSAMGLERMMRFLSERHGVPVMARLFNVFETSGGERLLIREVADGEGRGPAVTRPAGPSFAEVRAVAERAGMAGIFDTVAAAAEYHGLGTRVWKRSVMFTPASNRTRVLSTVWTSPVVGGLRMWVEPKGFAEFYDVTEEQAHDVLGGSGFRVLDMDAAGQFAERLRQLLAERS